MTKQEWNNLKVGDRVICRYENCWDCENELATVTHTSFSLVYNEPRVNVIWDNGKCYAPKNNWSEETSFDLIKKIEEINLFNGGAIL